MTNTSRKRDTRETTEMRALGERIRHVRLAVLKLSQPQLASLLEVDRSAIAHWERGSAVPGFNTLRLLAHLPERLSLSFLIAGVGPETIPMQQ